MYVDLQRYATAVTGVQLSCVDVVSYCISNTVYGCLWHCRCGYIHTVKIL